MKGVKEQMKANRMEERKRYLDENRSQEEEKRILGDTGSRGNTALPAITETRLDTLTPDRDIMSAMSAMSLANFKVVIYI